MKTIKTITLESFNTKLTNRLNEDAKTNAEIRAVARYIADFYMGRPEYKYLIPYARIVKMHGGDPPKITDENIRQFLERYIAFFYDNPSDKTQKNALGAYYPSPNGDGEIYLNREELTDANKITSTLVHELRHAFDDYKSNYTQQWIDKNFDNIKRVADAGFEYEKYAKLSHEVNARFSQVLLDIAEDPDITRENLRDKIVGYFKKNNITLKTLNRENDPRFIRASDRYKKLYAKAAAFWQQYEKIKTQPQTQIGIPQIPKSAKTVSSNITKKPGFVQRVKNIATKAVTSLFKD